MTEASSGTMTEASGTRTEASSGTMTEASGTRTEAASGTMTEASGTMTEASGTRTEASSGTMTEAASGTRTEAASGTMTEAASGTRTEAASGTMTEAASGTRTEAASGTRTEAASGTRTEAASGTRTEAASGTRTEAASGTMTEAAPHVLSSENVEVLEAGTSVRDFIDRTVERLSSEGSEGPFFVADLDSVARRYLRWIRNLPGVKPFYAVKCNSSPAVIRTLNALGTGFDCASKGEIQLALSLGVSPENIIFAHTTKPPSHLRFACSHGVNLMTFDSEEELTKISQCHSNAKLVLRLAVDDSASLIQLSSKFGARREEVDRLLRRALELGLDLTGVSFHVGCLCTDAVAFRKAIEDARQVFDAASSLGFQMSLLDIGGGFPGREDMQTQFEEFSRVIAEALRDHFPADGGVRVIAEPGRYFVLSAFTLAASVIAKKVVFSATDGRRGDASSQQQTSDEEQKPDRSMMYYINEGVHGSMKALVCEPANLTVEPYLHRAVDGGERRHRSVVWGPTCCAIDRVAVDCWFPELHVGDWLLVDNMGAYTLSLSTDFNGFERAHVYTVATEETWRQLQALQR